MLFMNLLVSQGVNFIKLLQDMTLIEIAKILKYPLGTVKTRLHKALGELRLDLKEELL